ncbi:MAG: hypothetical protein IPN40_12405 [Uliginosibacterium sp.]|nr:hypothetical protein [Uliginosibacterium sp.]
MPTSHFSRESPADRSKRRPEDLYDYPDQHQQRTAQDHRSKYVFEEIRNAVAAGKEVTIHERPIHAFGWSGSGYAVVDPETGAGAYMIDGRANGGALAFAAVGATLGLAGLVVGIGSVAGLIMVIYAFHFLLLALTIAALTDGLCLKGGADAAALVLVL